MTEILLKGRKIASHPSVCGTLSIDALTYCVLVDSSTVICWTSPFVILGCQIYVVAFLWKILLADNIDSEQTPHDLTSDLGLHRLPMILYAFQGKNRLKYLIVYFSDHKIFDCVV